MNDPRLTLMRDGVAAAALQGLVDAAEYRETTAWRCMTSSAPVRSAPDPGAQQEDQLLFGEAFEVLLHDGEFALGQAARDGYVGYVLKAALEAGPIEPTHWVSALRTYAFVRPDAKSPNILTLSMNSLAVVEDTDGKFCKVAGSGWVFEGHLTPIGQYLDDPAAIAEQYLRAPYQWGGRESTGVDCSGLIQQALYACGRACPRDTDMQRAHFTTPAAGPERNTLVFWEGHVGIMLDETRLLHANSHTMTSSIEPLSEAVKRIADMGFKVTDFRKL